MAGYIGANTSSVTNNQNAAERRKKFTFTANTTVLSGLNFAPEKIHIFHNGIRLVRTTDYTEAADGKSVTLVNAAQAGDEVVAVTFAQDPASNAGYTDADVDAHLLTAGVTLDATNDRVGIGTSTPTRTLHVEDASDATMIVNAASNNQATYLLGEGGASKFNMSHKASDNSFQIYNYYNNAISLKIDEDGHVTKPNQVYFHVKLNANVGHNGTTPAVKLNSWVALGGTYGGLGSDFSSANQRFTAPVDGRYLFNYTGLHNTGAVSGGYSRAYTYVNGALVIDGLGDDDTEGSYQRIAYSTIFDLSANDYVEIYINGTNANGFVYNHYTTWSGYLLG